MAHIWGDEKEIQHFSQNISRGEMLMNPKCSDRILLKYILEKGYGSVGWIELVQVTVRWRVSLRRTV